MVSAAQAKKHQKQRAAFFNLARQGIALLSLGLLLSQQPYLVKPRQTGENALKLTPLKLAVCGGIHWAAESPLVAKNPKLFQAINVTSQVRRAPVGMCPSLHPHASGQFKIPTHCLSRITTGSGRHTTHTDAIAVESGSAHTASEVGSLAGRPSLLRSSWVDSSCPAVGVRGLCSSFELPGRGDGRVCHHKKCAG